MKAHSSLIAFASALRYIMNPLAWLAFTGISATAAAQTVWNVAPNGPVLLETALANSSSEDIIVMAPGIYRPPGASVLSTFLIKSKTLTLTGGPATFDGDLLPGAIPRLQTIHVLTLVNAKVFLSNTTIINGRAFGSTFPSGQVDRRRGGGITCSNSELFMTNCAIQDCSAELFGGGVFALNSALNMDHVTMERNGVAGSPFTTSSVPSGGAVFLDSSVLRLKFGGFSSNIAGGTVNQTGGITWNDKTGSLGGAVFCRQSDMVVYNSLFTENQAAFRGGALFIESTVVAPNTSEATRFANCRFAFNHAGSAFTPLPGTLGWPGAGGAAFVASNLDSSGKVRWDNSTFDGNSSNGDPFNPLNPLGPIMDSIHAELTVPGGQQVLSVLTNCWVACSGSPSIVGPYLSGRNTVRSSGVPGIATTNGNVDPCTVPPLCNVYAMDRMVDRGSNALLTQDFLDLDGNGITAEPVPFPLGPGPVPGNPRVYDPCGFGLPVVDMGCDEIFP